MILAWVVFAPTVLLGLLLMAAWLETHIVAPGERARAIRDILSVRTDPEDVERDVAKLLRACDPPRRAV